MTEEQIPGNFSLSYTISDCGMCGEKTGTLSRGDATLVNSSGVPQLMWDVELPVVEHGNFTHTITFTEKNVNVAGYKAPVFSGNVVTLESLALDDDAPEGAKPVITVSNRYEPKDDVFVLSYDGMGGTGCPATQVVKQAGNSHTFKVAGAETEIQVPTNGEKIFLGWAWTEYEIGRAHV